MSIKRDFESDAEAWAILTPAGYKDGPTGIWHPNGMAHRSTDQELAALWYLFHEWDYVYDDERTS